MVNFSVHKVCVKRREGPLISVCGLKNKASNNLVCFAEAGTKLSKSTKYMFVVIVLKLGQFNN